MFELIGESKPRRWRVENSLCCYLLSVALKNINSTGSNEVGLEWIDVLEKDSVTPFEGMKSMEISSSAREVSSMATKAFRSCAAVSTPTELALACAYMVVKLVTENRVNDVNTQGVLVANAIVLEQAEEGGWGDSKLAKAGSEQMIKFFLSENYFSCKPQYIH